MEQKQKLANIDPQSEEAPLVELMQQQLKVNQYFNSVSSKLPQALIVQAERKVAEMKEFKEELVADFEEFEKIKAKFTEKVTKKIREKAFSEDSADFLLSRDPATYLNCIANGQIDKERLKNLLDENMAHWEDSLKQRQEEQEQLTNNLQLAWSQNMKQMSNLMCMHTQKVLVSERQMGQVTLHKTKMFCDGQNPGDSFRDFEWPSAREFQEMYLKDGKLKIKQIRIEQAKYNSYRYFSAIKVELSNGCESPMFRSRGGYEAEQVLNLNEGAVPKKVITSGRSLYYSGTSQFNITDIHGSSICQIDKEQGIRNKEYWQNQQIG